MQGYSNLWRQFDKENQLITAVTFTTKLCPWKGHSFRAGESEIFYIRFYHFGMRWGTFWLSV